MQTDLEMSNDSDDESLSTDNVPPSSDELPPVEPPSAAFILQLFVVPAIIVLAVVCVWALFGKIAAGEQDWRKQLAELRSGNVHRRWRGANALAQMLQMDQRRGDDGEHLAENREIAQELATLLEDGLKKGSPNDDDLKQQAFLALSLSMLDVHDLTMPVLQEASQPRYDREIRKNAIESILLVVHRARKTGRPLTDDDLVEDLIDVSRDGDPLFRQLGAYALGFFPVEPARQQLVVLLEDGDANTCLNAAVGLARHGLTSGYPVFSSVLLADADRSRGQPTSSERKSPADAEASDKRFERLVALKNTLTAVDRLGVAWSPDERTELIGLLEPIAKNHAERGLRRQAEQVLVGLREPATSQSGEPTAR